MKSLNDGRGETNTWAGEKRRLIKVKPLFFLISFLNLFYFSFLWQKAARSPTPPSLTSFRSSLCWRRAWRWVRGRSPGRRWRSAWTWSCSTWGRRELSLSWEEFTAPTPRANCTVSLQRQGCLLWIRKYRRTTVWHELTIVFGFWLVIVLCYRKMIFEVPLQKFWVSEQ